MSSKYYEAISEIKASDELKEKIKIRIEQENSKEVKKCGFIIKVKRWLMAVSATIVTLVCGGAVYAALDGTINGIPVAEWLGIKFSQNYSQYEENVEDKYVENDYAKIELQSTVCDDGFTILKFNVKFKEDIKQKIKQLTNISLDSSKDYGIIDYTLSFNNILLSEEDEVKNYSLIQRNNNNLIIDEKDYFINGSIQAVKEIIPNNEYTVYQMWFLTEEELENLDNFKITLNNVAIGVNGEYIQFEDNFDIKLSKSKAKDNTKEIKTNNEYISYKRMTKTIDEIKVTPLQNIIKLSTRINDANYNSLSWLDNEEYIGDIKYVVSDQNGNEIRNYNVETSRKIVYKDGDINNIDLREFRGYDENLEDVDLISTEYIAIEESEDIKKLNIEMYEVNQYYDTVTKIGEFTIDLVNESISLINEEDIIIEQDVENKKIENKVINDIKTFESNNIEWEEYPDNVENEVCKIVKKFMGDETQYLGKGVKTIYSIFNNNPYEDLYDTEYDYYYILENILYSYTDFAGDYFSQIETATNYNQYNYLSKSNKIEPYEEKIEFKTAIFNLSRYNEYTEDGLLKDITKKTKKQYEILKFENYNNNSGYYFGLDKMVVMNGNNTSKEDYQNNSRAKKIKVIVNNDKEYIFDLKDTNKVQTFDLNYKQQTIEKPVDITIEVLEIYGGEKTQDIYISDIQFGVETNISLGI